MQSLLFLRTNAFVLTADIFTNTNTVLIYYYENIFITAGVMGMFK